MNVYKNVTLFKKKDEAFTFLNTHPEFKLYAVDIHVKRGQKSGPKYFLVSKPKDIYNYMTKIYDDKPTQMCFYEHWNDLPVCLFIDFDLKNPPAELVAKRGDPILINFFEKTCQILRDHYQININSGDFLVQNSSREDKISFHIKCKHVRFNNILQQKYFWLKHKDEFDYEVDMAVYQTHMALRTVYSHKYRPDGARYTSKPTSLFDKPVQKTFRKYSVTDFSLNNTVFDIPIINPPDNLNVNGNANNNANGSEREPRRNRNPNGTIKSEEQLLQSVSGYRPNYPNSPIKELMENLKNTRAVDYNQWIFVCWALKAISEVNNDELYFNTFIEFSKQAKEFDKNSCLYYWRKAKRHSPNNNTDKKLFGKKSLIKWAKDDTGYVYQEPLRNLFAEAEKNNFYNMDVVKINQKYLGDIDQYFTGVETVFIKSGQGSDKTGKAIKFISNLRERRILHNRPWNGSLTCISRRNLATTISSKSRKGYFGYVKGEMPLVFIQNYGDLKPEQYSETENIAITPNSLVHLFQNNHVPAKTIMWIDEITAFLEYLTCENLKNNRINCMRILEWYIANVDYLLITDADISDDAFKIINMMRGNKSARFVWNEYKTDRNKYHFISKYDKLITICKQQLADGKNIYICTDTKKQTEHLQYLFKEYSPLVYNSDTPKQFRDYLKNIDEEWMKQRVVITNSVNEYGISYDDSGLLDEPHFHSIYGIFKGDILMAQGVNQLLHRVRHTQSNNIYIHLEKYSKQYFDTSLKNIKEMIQRGDKVIKTLLKEDDLLGIRCKVLNLNPDGYHNAITSGNLVFDEILARKIRTMCETYNDFYRWLKFYIEDAGGVIETDHCTDLLEDNYTYENFKDSVKDLQAEDKDVPYIVGARDISKDDLSFILCKSELSDVEKYKIKKFMIKYVTGFKCIDAELVKYIIRNKRFLEQIENFQIYMYEDFRKKTLGETSVDYTSSVGINSKIIMLIMVKELLELGGWNSNLDFSETHTISCGNDSPPMTENIKTYIKTNKDKLRKYFGDAGRIRIKQDTMVNFMGFILRIVNFTFGDVMTFNKTRVTVDDKRIYIYKFCWKNFCPDLARNHANTISWPILGREFDLTLQTEILLNKTINKPICQLEITNLNQNVIDYLLANENQTTTLTKYTGLDGTLGELLETYYNTDEYSNTPKLFFHDMEPMKYDSDTSDDEFQELFIHD